MGEASRRRKLDPDYGKVLSLSTKSLKEKHFEKILFEFMHQFPNELRDLLDAKTVPENYQAIAEQMRLWLSNRLSTYRESDRAFLAKMLFHTLVLAREEHIHNPLFISCLKQAVKDFLNPDVLQGLSDDLNKAFEKRQAAKI